MAYVAHETLVVFGLMHAQLLLGITREIAVGAAHILFGSVRQQVVHSGRFVLVHVATYVTCETHLLRVNRVRGVHLGVFLLQVVLEVVDRRETDTAQVTLVHFVLGVPFLEVP